MADEAVDGKIIALIDTTAFFNAESVKTFITSEKKPRAERPSRQK